MRMSWAHVDELIANGRVSEPPSAWEYRAVAGDRMVVLSADTRGLAVELLPVPEGAARKPVVVIDDPPSDDEVTPSDPAVWSRAGILVATPWREPDAG